MTERQLRDKIVKNMGIRIKEGIYSNGERLNLDLLIDDVESAKMDIKYFMIEEPKEFEIEDIIIVNDELKYNYNKHF